MQTSSALTGRAPQFRIGGKAIPVSLPSELIRPVTFLVCGGLAAGCSLLIRFVLNLFLPFEIAVALAFLFGAAVAFLLYQGAVFGNPGTPLRQRMLRFAFVDLVAAAITVGVSSILARWLLPAAGWTFHPFEFAHLAGVAAPAPWSYFAHQHLTFARGKSVSSF